PSDVSDEGEVLKAKFAKTVDVLVKHVQEKMFEDRGAEDHVANEVVLALNALEEEFVKAEEEEKKRLEEEEKRRREEE
ncbi:hypothetical protein A2U01_0068294, partial [Trifolium medium]|nr:hypothetical protein [Trifolium medium]